MKKILCLIGLCLFVTNVSAFEEGKWTDEVINDPNVVAEKSEVRYRWYKNVINYGPEYYIEGENDLEFPNIDNDKFIQTDFNEWSDVKPLEKLNRVIEVKGAGRYRTLRPIRYLFLENMTGGFLTFNIAELNVLIDDQEVPVSMTCTNCSDQFNYYVNDDQYDNTAYINNGGSLMIDLGAYYGIEQIKLELYMYDRVPNTKRFDIYYNEGDTLLDRNYAHKEISIYVVSDNSRQPEKHLIMPDATFIENPVYTDWIYIDGNVNTTYYRQMQFLCLYRYKDIKYQYYRSDRFYMDGYYAYVNDPEYIKDESSAKTFYLYKNISIINNADLPNENSVISNNVDESPDDTLLPVVEKTNIINKRVVQKGNNQRESDETVTSEKGLEPVGNLLAISDNHEKKITQSSKSISWLELLSANYCVIYPILLMLLIAVLLVIRHRILSHQK
jgi:hypothetical protein